MKALSTILVATAILLITSCGQKEEYKKNTDGSLTWISIDEASKLQNTDQKLYFVDVYTSWCKWCKVMDQQTFTDPEVIKALEAQFHMVKFNAEQTEIVNWKGNEYIYKPGGRRGIHSLAPELLNGRLSYPSFAILDKDRNPIKIIVGFKRPQQLLNEIQGLAG